MSCPSILGGGETLVSALLDIDGLRDFCVRAQWQNLIKDMRVEEYKTIYDAAMVRGGILAEEPVYGEPPPVEADQLELVKHQINKMVDRGGGICAAGRLGALSGKSRGCRADPASWIPLGQPLPAARQQGTGLGFSQSGVGRRCG